MPIPPTNEHMTRKPKLIFFYSLALAFNLFSLFFTISEGVQLDSFSKPGMDLTEMTALLQLAVVVMLTYVIVRQIRINSIMARVNKQATDLAQNP